MKRLSLRNTYYITNNSKITVSYPKTTDADTFEITVNIDGTKEYYSEKTKEKADETLRNIIHKIDLAVTDI